MVKVTIEFDGKKIEHEGDFVFGNVVSSRGSGFSVREMAAGEADVKQLPVVMGKTMIEQVLKVYEEKETLERLDKLCQFATEVIECTSKEISKHEDEVSSLLMKILGGGFRRWQYSVKF